MISYHHSHPAKVNFFFFFFFFSAKSRWRTWKYAAMIVALFSFSPFFFFFMDRSSIDFLCLIKHKNFSKLRRKLKNFESLKKISPPSRNDTRLKILYYIA